MYTREILEKRYAPVENGIPLQGTWTTAFDEVDLLSVQRPYSIPLLKSIKDFRIKEWDSFIIKDDHFFLLARLCNHKLYRSATVIMYNMETGERQEFSKMIPVGGWRLPRSLHNGSVDSRSMGFFFRIHSWLDAECIKLELNIEPKRRRPAFTAHTTFDLAAGKATPMAVSLLFSDRRNMYAFKVLTEVWGDVVFGGRHIHLNPVKTSGLFSEFKGFFPYRTRFTWCNCIGFDSQNRQFGFSLGENQAREPFKNNENAFWIDGKLTPLPPVKITRNGGPDSDWIIQDMEGMVDLVFTPKAWGHAMKNFIIASSDYESPLGYFNGRIINNEGEEFPFHNVWGLGEKLYLRV
ncbi:MAG: DUF2804 domain-containing protein [Treponema sp.]|nr:DUF2804 domain-containing protein [Treponema sp.]